MAESCLDPKKERLLAEFSDAMRGLYGEDLVSLNLVGEAAMCEPDADRGQIKLVAVMREIGFQQLKKYREIGASWLKKGIHPPLMLTRETLDGSTDVFPIEYYEMKEAHRVLYGEDILSGLEISHENLRRQCEEQVKGKFIHLRQAYMDCGGEREPVARLISASIPHFAGVMRNIMRLTGMHVMAGKTDAVREFCAKFGLSAGPFEEALALRTSGRVPPIEAVERLFGSYLKEVGRLAELIDKLTF